MPWIVPERPQRKAAAITAPLARTSKTPVTDVRVSSVPPSAPKATPTRAAPSISGTALAATLEERDTRGRDLGQERNPGQRRHSLTHGGQAAGQSEQAEHYQREQKRQRDLVGGTGQVEEAAAVRLQARPADVDRRRVALAVGDRREVALVVRAGGGLACGIDAADAGTVRAAAPVRPTLDGRGDHVAAVRVLVGVGREVVLRLAQLLVRVLAVELAVPDAVAQNLVGAGGSGRGHGEEGEYAEDNQISYGSVHVRIPPADVVRVLRGRSGDGARRGARRRLDRLLPDCGANASNWPRRLRCGADNRILSPGLGMSK